MEVMENEYETKLVEMIRNDIESFKGEMMKGQGNKYVATSKRLLRECRELENCGTYRSKASGLIGLINKIKWLKLKHRHVSQKMLEDLRI